MRITPELLRKRAEHNEGVLETLEEITLHQYKIRRIECLGDCCRRLRILLLQSNKIARIENLSRLKNLEYLNLALNRITRIENLESLENLEKLDLTANFVYNYKDLRSIAHLSRLRELYLVGNPCTTQPYYREFAIVVLQHLEKLDGAEITRTERLAASQVVSEHRDEINARVFTEEHPDWAAQSDGSDYEDNDPAKKVKRAAAESAEQDVAKKRGIAGGLKETRPDRTRDTTENGRVRQYNELGCKFSLNEQGRDIILAIDLPRYLSTESISIDVEPDNVLVKSTESGRRMLVALPYEVHTHPVRATRISTTGVLKIRMHVVDGVEMAGNAPRMSGGYLAGLGDDSTSDDAIEAGTQPRSSQSLPVMTLTANTKRPGNERLEFGSADVDDDQLEESVPSDVPDLL